MQDNILHAETIVRRGNSFYRISNREIIKCGYDEKFKSTNNKKYDTTCSYIDDYFQYARLAIYHACSYTDDIDDSD